MKLMVNSYYLRVYYCKKEDKDPKNRNRIFFLGKNDCAMKTKRVFIAKERFDGKKD
jgi:hypothetical protein